MTITLHLNPEVEAGLLAKAQVSGVELEEYLLSVVEGVALSQKIPLNAGVVPDRVEAVHRMLAYGEKYHLSLGEPITRSLLHEGHRF